VRLCRGRGWSITSVIVLAVAPTLAQNAWHDAAPLPAPMGEIVGEVVQGRWYIMAGLNAGGPMGVVYVFDPANNTWTTKKPMPVPAHHIMTATLNGKIYVFGGFVRPNEGNGWQPITASWEYDPAKDGWRQVAAMPTPRGAGSAVECNGKVGFPGTFDPSCGSTRNRRRRA
jgi:N-acetylneuraminic acid mutarotase